MSNTLMLSAANEINNAHRQAIAHADKAIDYARLAGDLLMQVKADLPHGEFLPWIESNIDVTPRQVQRYMAVAQGKPMPIRKLASKATPVSYLPGVEIPMCSVGLVKWQDSQGNNLLFEIHPFMFPDGVTLGYRSAYIVFDRNERFGAFTEYDKRGMYAKYFSVRDHAKRWDVPLESLTVHEDCEPYLWTFMHDWDLADAKKAVAHE